MMNLKHKKSTFRQLIKREIGVILLGLPIFLGAAAFFILIRDTWSQDVSLWWWLLPIAATFIVLPKLYTRRHGVDEPYIIRFAWGFGSGFLALQTILRNFIDGGIKFRELWDQSDKDI